MKTHPTNDRLVLIDGELYFRLDPTFDSNGYPMVTVPIWNGKLSGRFRTHRLIWEIINCMTVPKGKVIRHYNDNKLDQRPENLIVGSQSDNITDMVRNGNSTRGAKNAQCKLSERDVLSIRERRYNKELLRTLADEYGVSVSSVGDIVKRRTWSWLN
ncbi:MAG: HNH endonuclease [Pseudomonadota bacterium]|nr:HNH endonuclease [Pseudomonadota bacterium]